MGLSDLARQTENLANNLGAAADHAERLAVAAQKAADVRSNAQADFNQGTGGGAAGATGNAGSGGVTNPGTGPQLDANGRPFFGPSGGGGGAQGGAGAGTRQDAQAYIAQEGPNGKPVRWRSTPDAIIGIVVGTQLFRGFPVMDGGRWTGAINDAAGNDLTYLLKEGGSQSAGGGAAAGPSSARSTLGLPPGGGAGGGNGITPSLPPPPSGGAGGGSGDPNMRTLATESRAQTRLLEQILLAASRNDNPDKLRATGLL